MRKTNSITIQHNTIQYNTIQYHAMVNPKTTALPLLLFNVYRGIWNLVYQNLLNSQLVSKKILLIKSAQLTSQQYSIVDFAIHCK